MKLILANNQSERFQSFYQDLQTQSTTPFEYYGYESLLFEFNTDAAPVITVTDTNSGRSLTEYNGVYLNGYLSTYELAATVATCCQALGIPFVNQELANAPSLSKLTGYAKLAAAGVSVPHTLAGTKIALLKAEAQMATLPFPLVLKRADADRGIDNYKVRSPEEIRDLLASHTPRSLWILQEYVENDGFYLVSFYDQKPVFSIFRSLEARPDGNEQKAHMYKPHGGANAHLIELKDIPGPAMEAAQNAMVAMNRQIGSVDCLFSPETAKAYVLEVNYNPQLVTIETFKDVRVQAFLEGIEKIGG
jgi:glutathione synthase/RimK-type ligase-like ATP-grasp enzyme